MPKERPQITPEQALLTIEGARTFSETGSTFGDNFRFTARGLARLASIDDQELDKAVQTAYDILIRDTSDEDLYDLLKIGITDQIYLEKIFSQMDEQEVVSFVRAHRQTMLTLNPSEEQRFAFMRDDKRTEEVKVFNQGLEQIATALLGMNVAPWNLRR